MYSLIVLLLAPLGHVYAGIPEFFPMEGLPTLVLPFFGLLFALAALPVLKAHIWERYYRWIVLSLLTVFAVPFCMKQGVAPFVHLLSDILLLEYIPFGLLISSLYIITGNMSFGHLYKATPLKNVIYLFLASMCASVAGTTGASMIFIRPFMRANAFRKSYAHGVIFFIFLVANVGGSLTPLGDPPLFLGYLSGVPFFWPFKNLIWPTLVAISVLLLVFFIVDTYVFSRDKKSETHVVQAKRCMHGKHNILYLIGVIVTLMLSGYEAGNVTEYTSLSFLRDLFLVIFALLSYMTTPKSLREENDFSWQPLEEVLVIFFGLFVLVAPAIALLAKKHAVVQPILEWFSACGQDGARRYFWGTGFFSSFLDNAPTYLVFVHLTGCTLDYLIHEAPRFLAAISAGAVFMGAMTYIGNAPNFMVKAIAEKNNVAMPGFLGYMCWASFLLLPTFALVDAMFFSGDFSFC